MSGLARDTGRLSLSRETKFSGASGDRENTFFPVPLTTSRAGLATILLVDVKSTICDDYTCIHTCIHTHIHTYLGRVNASGVE